MKKTMKLTDIRIDGGTQSRVAINTDAVEDYAKAMLDGDQLPPLLVFFDGAAFWLADGFHRWHASRKVGLKEVEVDVVQGTIQDAKLHAYGANKSHGLRRTNEDKRKAVLGMLEDFGSWSDNKIAKHVGVSHPFVGALRSSLVTVTSETPTKRTFTTKHGGESIMDTSGIGKGGGKAKTNPKPQPPDTAKPSGPQGPVDEAGGSTAARKPPPEVADASPEDLGPSAEEMAYLERKQQEFQNKLGELLEADEPLRLATERWEQAEMTVAALQSRINGLLAENAELIKEVKRWRNLAQRAAA